MSARGYIIECRGCGVTQGFGYTSDRHLETILDAVGWEWTTDAHTRGTGTGYCPTCRQVNQAVIAAELRAEGR